MPPLSPALRAPLRVRGLSLLFAALSVLSFAIPEEARAQQEVSVPFKVGFIGTQGSNTQQANNVLNFSTLGVTAVRFVQVSSNGAFTYQGNDFPGSVRFFLQDGTVFDIEGAIVWRISSGNTAEVYGFIPASTTNVTISYGSSQTYTVTGSSNIGLRINSSSRTFVDGQPYSGNAANNGLDDDFNDYLSETQLVSNVPAGPVTVTPLSTTNTTPTVTGSVTLVTGETLSVEINGKAYTNATTTPVTISGTTWSVTLPAGDALAVATYPVTATITNAEGYTLLDSTTDELVISNVADVTAPLITGPSGNAGDAASAKSVPEGTTLVHTFTANEAVTWTLTGGTDPGDFSIDPSTGALTFRTAPDFENPADHNTDNVYQVTVTAIDGSMNSSTQTVTVTVTDVDDTAPLITGPSGNAGDAASAKSVPEGTTAVHTFTANESVTWSLTGGADQGDFSIDPSTGALTFSSAPDFENPADDGTNNVYEVVVTATDGSSNVSNQTVTVTVTDLAADATASTITASPATGVAADGTTTSTITVQLKESTGENIGVGGDDVTLATTLGSLSSVTDNNDGTYTALLTSTTVGTATITAYLGQSQSDPQIGTATVGFIQAPVNAGQSTVVASPTSVPADGATTSNVTVSLKDAGGNPVVNVAVSLTADAGSSTITAGNGGVSDPNGLVGFAVINTVDEQVTYTATADPSGTPITITQTASVTFTPVPDASQSTLTTDKSTVAADGVDYATVTLQLRSPSGAPITTGGQTIFFFAPSATISNQTDNGDGTHTARVSYNNALVETVSAHLGPSSFYPQVGPININFVSDVTPPVITGPSGSAGDAASAKSVPEGTTAVHTFTANESVTWSLAGGADQADFSINASTGALSFATAPDFEAPADADTNNVYVVVVRATDGVSNTSNQTVTITVTDLDEAAPLVTGPSGNPGDAASAKSVPEGTTAVHTFMANELVTWSLTGGTDQADFSIDASTGALSFATAPDFEAPADADTNNVYQVIVTATDTASNASNQTVTITVTDVDETAPVVTAAPGIVNDTLRITLTNSDTTAFTDFNANETVTWSLTALTGATADLAKFRINASSGALSFVEPPVDGNYKVKVVATDSASNATETVVLVRVDLKAPIIVAPDTIRISGEWSTETEVVGVILTRFEADEPVTWALSSIADRVTDVRRFTVGPTSGDFAVRSGTPLGEYKMLLSGTDAAGLSIEITVTVRVIGELRAPQLSGEPGDGLASLTWTEPVAGLFPITGYVLEYRTGSGDWIRINDLTELAQIVSGLENGRPYDFRVAARDSDGRQSPWSNIVTVVPSAPVTDANDAPPAPEPGGGLERTDDGFVPVTIERTETDDVKATTTPIELTLTALDSLGVNLPVDPAQPVLRLQREGSVETKGTGFEPGTYADVFIFTPEGPRRLGQLLVGEDGTFEGEFPLPDDLPNGFHVIQVNGIDEEGAQRSVSVTGVLGGEENLTVDVISSNLQPAPGEAIELVVIVTNRGSETAYDVEFDEGYILTRVDVETRTPERGEVDVEAGIWRIGTLAPGESVRLTLQGTVIIPETAGSGEGR